MADNQLYYGDNLTMLRRYVPDEAVDLVYLDPPFNSKQTYNAFFKERTGVASTAQIKAFVDTWQWDYAAAHAFNECMGIGGPLADAMMAFRKLLRESDMMAYLAMMAPRLYELHRVLKPTGSLYLHCDPTASHYLKIVMDSIFGPTNFRNEIVWKRTSSHNDSKRYADIHDCILYYGKSTKVVWNAQHIAHNENYIRTHYNRTDARGRQYRLDNIIRSASMGARPNLAYEYKGYKPEWGWRVSREKLEAIDIDGRLVFSKSGTPYLVRYLDEMQGTAVPSWWDNIAPVNSQAAERLGYPTQKPLGLLERIIAASSNPGDVVLDPFCGCGTAIEAAQKLDRHWIGIDITHLAINLIRDRLLKADPEIKLPKVVGAPTTPAEAAELARTDPYQFQWWALDKAQVPVPAQKKGADQGIDGRMYFLDQTAGGYKQVIVSVKAGKTDVSHVRDLRGVIERERAEIGVLISMQEPTKPMRTEALAADFYHSAVGRHPRIQLLSVDDLFAGKPIDYPVRYGLVETPRPRKRTSDVEQLPLGDADYGYAESAGA